MVDKNLDYQCEEDTKITANGNLDVEAEFKKEVSQIIANSSMETCQLEDKITTPNKDLKAALTKED